LGRRAITYANFRALLTDREARGELVVDDTQYATEQFLACTVILNQRPPTERSRD
jgi:hypothetical protein